MKTLYLECAMGAGGDRLMAALLELYPDPSGFLRQFGALGIPGVEVSVQPCVTRGVRGTRISIAADGGNLELDLSYGYAQQSVRHEVGIEEMKQVIDRLSLPDPVRQNVRSVGGLIAGAESRTRNVSMDNLRFDEGEAMETAAYIIGVSLLLHELSPSRILSSPVCVGFGQVRRACGILPVPTPAAADILRGVPTRGGSIEGELCTPLGAALLKHFVSDFIPMPALRIERIGYGIGEGELEAVDCVRAMWGDDMEKADMVVELSCHLDDMTPEAVGFAMERLFDAGAAEAYVTPIQMKKDRPGVLLTCMCRPEQRDNLLRTLFRHTTALEIRELPCSRYLLHRSERVVETGCGLVRIKTASGWGVRREKAEYSDLARIARETGCSLAEAESLTQS